MNISMVDMERLCEIAFIFGQLLQAGDIEFEVDGMEEAFKHYQAIYEEWLVGEEKGTFKSEEEAAYVSAYASRVILERYGKAAT